MRVFTSETLRSAAKQSQGIHHVPPSLIRSIKRFLQEKEKAHMHRKVLRLSESFESIKDANLQLVMAASRELVEDPLKKCKERSKRWKIKSSYGDIGLTYGDDEAVAYVASRMPAVYSACHRVLREVRRRLPDFSPKRVLDFGSGPGTALWAMRGVWPRSLERVNLVEPSKTMQRTCQSLLEDLKDLPVIHSYESIQALTRNIEKTDREHDLVIASYALGEIPSLKDRITVVRQLWDLTRDVLVLVEPGTPHGFDIIHQMRSHILWMANRKCRKNDGASSKACEDMQNSNNMMALRTGAFVIAPCSHDGPCPLAKSEKYCHFVQRLERTSSQRTYKRSKGESLRGFEDEKFCFVALRRGVRPQETWPLDDVKFETERQTIQEPEDLDTDYEEQLLPEADEDISNEEPVSNNSDITDSDTDNGYNEEDEQVPADLGGGWGRIIFTPVRRGNRVTMDVCRSTKQDGSEGSFERIVISKMDNPGLHRQARKSLWGDLWPF
ncbi:hypothetical protein QJS10_CPA10g00644 [Acorus calamus]|uniref:Methyltransferase-like protein 17, mitochondrial n=1 Tax=Acorus calamus TaxID=4465 RepID=A0AAV9E3S4_ACOCL|nr:hypothetical protein QJS10_CPA10g00644 [Acorus calamus]